jgi:hypothetical protein
MQSYILRIVIALFVLIVWVGVSYPLAIGQMISTDGSSTSAYILTGVIIASLLYILVVYAIMPMHHARQKTTLLAIGLIYIYIWYTILVNNTALFIYTGDVVRLAGAMIILFGATWVAIPAWVQAQKIEKNLEIIEV